MSMAPSAVPMSRWSRGSKSKVGTSPTVRRVTASSSPPGGTSGATTLAMARCAARSASSAARVASSAAFTSADRAFARSRTAGRSSGVAFAPTGRPSSAPRAGCRRGAPPRGARRRRRAGCRPGTRRPRGRAGWHGRRRGHHGAGAGRSRADGRCRRVGAPPDHRVSGSGRAGRLGGGHGAPLTRRSPACRPPGRAVAEPTAVWQERRPPAAQPVWHWSPSSLTDLPRIRRELRDRIAEHEAATALRWPTRTCSCWPSTS